MTYQRESAWQDDPAQAQELCEILHRSHPEVMEQLEKAVVTSMGLRPQDVLTVQVKLAYEDGKQDGFEEGYRAGQRELGGKIRKVIPPGL